MLTESVPSKPESESLIHRLESILARLEAQAIFGQVRPLQAELGSGDGSFLVKYAQLHPEYHFWGVERLLGRLRKIDKKGRRAGLTNLRVLRIEASYFLDYLLPRQSLEALHIYFPDPWPKRKHRKNRLVNEAFTESARQVLKPGGIVYLRTDDADYFEQMTTVFGANSTFQAVATPEELALVVTDFERNFNLRGVPTLRAAYQLK